MVLSLTHSRHKCNVPMITHHVRVPPYHPMHVILKNQFTVCFCTTPLCTEQYSNLDLKWPFWIGGHYMYIKVSLFVYNPLSNLLHSNLDKVTTLDRWPLYQGYTVMYMYTRLLRSKWPFTIIICMAIIDIFKHKIRYATILYYMERSRWCTPTITFTICTFILSSGFRENVSPHLQSLVIRPFESKTP